MTTKSSFRTLVTACVAILATSFLAAPAVTYYWIGSSSGDWNSASNWSLTDGGGSAGDYPRTVNDEAVFTAAASVSLATASATVSNVQVNAALSIVGNGKDLWFWRIQGDGVVSLSTMKLRAMKSGMAIFSAPLNIPAGVTVDACVTAVKDGNISGLEFTGKVTGSGKLSAHSTGTQNSYQGVKLSGNVSEFAGVLEYYSYPGQNRDRMVILPGESTSSNAQWSVFETAPTSVNMSDFDTSGTYYFGSFKGRIVSTPANNILMEIGHLNLASSMISGTWGTNSGVRWIASSATFSSSASNMSFLELTGGGSVVATAAGTPVQRISFKENGGVFKFAAGADVDISAIISESTAPICFDDGGIDRSWGSPMPTNNVGGFIKKGAGTLALAQQTINGPLVVESGKIGMANQLSGEPEALLTWTTSGSSVTLDNFNISVVSPMSLAIVNDAETGLSSLVVQRAVLSYVWAGGGQGYWNVATNWTVDGVPAVLAPSSADAVAIGDNTALIVEDGQVISNIVLGVSSKLAVIVPATGVLTFALPTGLSSDDIVPAGPYTLAYDSATGFSATRIPSSFTWTGSENATWSNAANWLVDQFPTEVAPSTTDEVVFESSALTNAISISTGDMNVSNLVFNADMTLEGDPTSMRLVTFYGFSGTGKITLRNANLRPYSFSVGGTTSTEPNLTIANNFEISEGTTNRFLTACKSNDDYIYTEYSGNLSGRGVLVLTAHDQRRRGGNWLSGGNSAFEGEVRLVDNNYYNRSFHHFSTAQAVGAKMKVYLSYNGHQGYAGIFPFQEKNATYEIGSLNGSVDYYSEGNGGNSLYKVGSRNEDCTVSGDWMASRTEPSKIASAGLSLEWLATTATMNWDAAKMNTIAVTGGGTFALVTSRGLPNTSLSFTGQGGTLKTGYDLVADPADASVTNAIPVDPSAVLKSSTATIVFDDQGTNATWATALASSNVGGFTKKGTGTLTLSVAPQYTGSTRLEGGQVVIMTGTFSADDTTVVVADPAAAYAAGTIFLQAPAIGGRPTLESSAPEAIKYKIAKKTVADKTVLYVEKATGFYLIVR